MNAVIKYPIIPWEDYVKEFETYIPDNSTIFRGQSNYFKIISPIKRDKAIITKELIQWGLNSSFNRHYEGTDFYRFNTFISQQLQNDLFKLTYSDYVGLKGIELGNMSLIDKIQFLQHYSIPTCFIDFTKDPLIALYFSISSIKGSSGNTLDKDYNIANYPNDFFLSIYKIDSDYFQKIFKIKSLESEDDLGINYDNYTVYLEDKNPNSQHVILGTLLNPKINESNYNLKIQNGAFILYDCLRFNFRGNGLETFIEEYVNRRNLTLEKPIIEIYRISYNSIFANRRRNKESLFKYLYQKKIIGRYLFNDFQGLKYDFNFFHHL